ncbi:Thioredoxin-like protein [Quillaja saponaria]|uniref:Thioredoxin-like protein n=1 Tax=Quillaja saponaria TaxID=32244 RepID=A0AAD7LF56_QUISA|nr:Thioredoxin-like protein [Quillaja saponaria]
MWTLLSWNWNWNLTLHVATRLQVEMALQHSTYLPLSYLFSPVKKKRSKVSNSVYSTNFQQKEKRDNAWTESSSLSLNFLKFSRPGGGLAEKRLRVSRKVETVNHDDADGKKERSKASSDTDEKDDESPPFGVHDPYLMDPEERKEWRRKIKQVIDKNPAIGEEVDPVERRNKMQKLLDDYPLVVEEEDPNWPENADGWGFNLGQFFDKITIKNTQKADDENCDSDNEIMWQDDNYIRPIKDLNSAEWEETVFKDISPLVILVHNRYKRPIENERIQDELEKAVHIIWNCRLPSPRCVAIDAVVELELVAALRVSVFPEIIFTKAGKILYREKAIRSADELSKIMAFFYYGAAKPPCLNGTGSIQEEIPSVHINNPVS